MKKKKKTPNGVLDNIVNPPNGGTSSNSKNDQKCPKGNRDKPLDIISEKDSKGFRSRKLVFTSFDVEEPHHDFENDEIWKNQVKFLIYEREKCPKTGKFHYQGFVYFYEKVTIIKAKKVLKIKDGWFQYAFSGIQENINYCSKEKNAQMFGTQPQQGKRKDLEELRDDVRDGKVSVDEIAVTRPNMYHQYGRTLEKIEDISMRKVYRTEMTKGIWYYGETGVGKSHKAYEDYNPETHYDLIDDNGWWDGYKQQKVVIINDYRGWIPYDRLLTLVDKWPTKVRRRAREPLPFTSKEVRITSSLHPAEVYHNRDENDKIEQLLRRFKIIKVERLPVN